MDKISLSQELKNYIRFAHLKFTRETTLPKSKPMDSYKFNSAFLSKREQDNLYGLYLFMRCHTEISDEALQDIISDDETQLKTLRALSKEHHGLVSNIRNYGYNNICNSIVRNRKLRSFSNLLK